MAWQLIYTSAPRSLEAGRSGFGTVARHRAITPLLASAIERISQFSRLPGTDADRVIFCHRIIAVGGGRFHVLSMIRDAGADYTGRTNHIAHHLIAEPREIAQLGAGGMSPADVMLAMNWAKSWNEPPRYFEATEEVDLSAMHPQTTDSAWQWVAGSAEHAWLLAVGDASRGAYVISPGGTDLRAIFAESLRLMPERLWQISFTTSLQPSDEPADFRWIGIEEQSPLRSQSAASGRPVLDLSAPKTLPLPEVPQFSPAVQLIEEPEPEISVSTSEKSPSGTDLRLPSIKIQVGTAPTYLYNKPKSAGRSHQQTKQPNSSSLWLYVSGFLLLAIGFGVFFVGWPDHRKEIYAKIDVLLGHSVFKKAALDLKKEENIDVALALAEAAHQSWLVASNTDVSEMQKLSDASKIMTTFRQTYLGFSIPEDIDSFEKCLRSIVTIDKELSEFTHDKAKFANLNEWKNKETFLLKSLESFDLKKFTPPLVKCFQKMRAKTVEALFRRGESLDSLMAELENNKILNGDSETKAIYDKVLIWNDAWALVEKWKVSGVNEPKEQEARKSWIVKNRDLPDWLIKKAKTYSETTEIPRATPAVLDPSKLPAPPSPPPATVRTVPLYFFPGEKIPLRIKLPKPVTSSKFILTEKKTPPYELSDLTKKGNLRKNINGLPIFKLGRFEEKENKFVFDPPPDKPLPLPFNAIELEKNDLKLPFCLSVEDDRKTEVFQFWFVQQSSTEPLFGNRSAGLKNDGTNILIEAAIAQLPGSPSETLYLETPVGFSPGSKSTPYPLSDMRLFLDPIIKSIKELKKGFEVKRDAVPNPTVQTLFNQYENEAKLILTEKGLKEYQKKQPPTNVQRCGEMLIQYGYDITYIGLNDVPKLPVDKLLNCGKNLQDADRRFTELEGKPIDKRGGDYDKNLKEKKDKVEEAKKAAILLVDEIVAANLPDFKKKTEKLTSLQSMLILAKGDEPRVEELLRKPKADSKIQYDSFDRLATAAGDHPLLKNRLPPGRYRLLVDFSTSEASSVPTGMKLPLLEFSIQDQDPPKKDPQKK